MISSKIWASQAKNSQAKPSEWRVVERPMSHGERRDSVYFERGVKKDLFAAVLMKLGRLSMYKIVY